MKRQIQWLYIAAALVAFVATSCSSTKNVGQDNKQVLLRFQPQKGDSYIMKLDMGMAMSGLVSMNMDMKMDMLYNVKEVDAEGNVSLENIFERMIMDMKNPMANISYDSDNPADDPAAKTMHEAMSMMLHKSLRSKLSNRATVLESVDFRELMAGNPEMLAQADQMNESASNSFVEFPEEAIKLGGSWDSQKETSGQQALKISTTYTVTEITKKVVTLDLKGTLAFQEEAQASGGGTFTGTMTLDRATGMLQTSKVVQDIKASTMGMEMGMTNTISMTMEKK